MINFSLQTKTYDELEHWLLALDQCQWSWPCGPTGEIILKTHRGAGRTLKLDLVAQDQDALRRRIETIRDVLGVVREWSPETEPSPNEEEDLRTEYGWTCFVDGLEELLKEPGDVLKIYRGTRPLVSNDQLRRRLNKLAMNIKIPADARSGMYRVLGRLATADKPGEVSRCAQP